MRPGNIARILSITALAAAGCASVPLGPLPQKDADFKLPTSELVQLFPAVPNLHSDIGKRVDRTLTLTNLLDLWGEPVSQRIYWEGEISKYAIFGGLGATSLNTFSPQMLGYSLAVPAILSPRPMRQYVWEKGEYQITATFGRLLFQREPKLLSWEWARRDSRSNQVSYNPWLRARNESGLFFAIGHSVGGDEIAHSADRSIVLHAGDNTEWSAGWRFSLLEHWGMRISYGYRYSGFVGMVQGSNLVQWPVRTVLEYQWPKSSLRAGVGIVYALHPKLSLMDGYGQVYTLNYADTSGLVAQMEYRPWAGAGIGVRLESLAFTHVADILYGSVVTSTLDATSIGMYWAKYF